MPGPWPLFLSIGLLLAVAAVGFGLWLGRGNLRRSVEGAQRGATQLLEEARRSAELARRDGEIAAREELLRVREQAGAEARERRTEIEERSAALTVLETSLADERRRIREADAGLDQEREMLRAQTGRVAQSDAELQRMIVEQRTRLERIAGVSSEEARRELLGRLEEEARSEAARLSQRLREDVHRDFENQARRALLITMQRMAAEQSIESTVTIVPLPSDEMKGRIIGREGRNIRAFEMATGVDVLIDDTPEAVLLSGFDPMRREIARRALVRLIADGRIHPGRIEEVVAQVGEGFDDEIVALGVEAAGELAITGLSTEVHHALGRLQFRTSSGQNVLKHSVEVARLAGQIAAELGLNSDLARRAGLLHDIGKGLGAEIEGPHALAGRDFLRRYGEAEAVHEAVGAHHGEVPSDSLIAIVVSIADAISSARPGARREALENYVRRLHRLEEIATAHPGVEKAYAIQAGREIRILVQHEKVGDADANGLAHAVARQIERDLPIPGQVKVVVIREMRAVDFAR